jgi:hypothetical protein
MRAVVDTNVVLVANNAHEGVTPACVKACIDKLESLKRDGRAVIDDGFRIVSEYLHKTTPDKGKGVGDAFVRWLLQNRRNPARVEEVQLSTTRGDEFAEISDRELHDELDAPDRKFIATAAAHPARPPVWQGTDCKWLDWWERLHGAGVQVEFICPDDVCRFYRQKFPRRNLPPLP